MLIFAAILAILVYGIVAATWGNLNPTLGFSDAQIGTISMWQAIGLMVASISVGPLIDLKGKKVALLGGLGLIAISLWSLPAARGDYHTVLMLLAVLGLGGGIVVTGSNALVSDISESRRGSMLNLLNLFFGLGGLLTPLITANLLDGVATRMCYVAAAMATVTLGINAVAPIPKPTGERGFKGSEMGSVLGRPALYLLSLFLFLYVACEVGIWNWLVKYLSEVRKLDPNSARNILSLGFALGLLIGRLVVSRILHESLGAPGHAGRRGGHGRNHFLDAPIHQPFGRLGGGVLHRPGDGAHVSHHAGHGGRRLPAHDRHRHGDCDHQRLARVDRKLAYNRQHRQFIRPGDRTAAAARVFGGHDSRKSRVTAAAR